MEYRILGSLEVTHGGSTVVIGGPRHRRLLSVLLMFADEVVSSDRLIDALWGEHPPSSAHAMVHVRVSEVRSALRRARPDKASCILTRGGGYELRIGNDELDRQRFEALVAAGRAATTRGELQIASERLRQALALWRGSAYADVADLAFAAAEIAHLEALHLTALENRLGVDLAMGRHDEVIAELEPLVVAHPLRERFWYQLMLAKYRVARQGEALETYQTARRVLMEGLGVEPGPELRRLHAAILQHDAELELQPSAEEARHNLPAEVSSFVGRAWELAELQEQLKKHRLVTVVGVGGAGKSRLLVEAARRYRRTFPGGCWLVELAPLSQPGLVAHAVARVIGLRESPERPVLDQLVDHLTTSQTLLLLDNCEHLIDEAAELAKQLLRSCDGLRVVATSRERLGITGEVLLPLAGLTVPADEEQGLNGIAVAESVQLFAQRASAALPGFRLDGSTVVSVAEICRRLDGLPLAIELAAIRVNALGVKELASRLDHRFTLLNHGDRTALPRHQTLRAVVEWSYNLLGIAERSLFDQISIFVGGFDLDAAQAVCGEPPGETASAIARLVDQSLLMADTTTSQGNRYRQLETIRAYGIERVNETGRTGLLQERHATYFLSFAQPAAEGLRGPDQAQWLDRLEAEHSNLRAALEWSINAEVAEIAVGLAGSLYPFWDLHGHYREGQHWLAAALALSGEVRPSMRARALMGSATLAVIQGDLDHAASACVEALELSSRASDPAGLAHAQQYLGLGAIFADDIDTAQGLLDQSLGNARLAGDLWLEGWALTFLSAAKVAQGEYDVAARLSSVCEAVSREAGDPECVAWALLLTGMATWLSGDHIGSTASLWEALRSFERLGALWGLSVVLFLSAQLAQARAQEERHIQLLGASERVRSSVGAGMVPFVGRWLDNNLNAARARLGDERFERAWQSGQTLSLGAAIADAIQEFELATALQTTVLPA
jgi:predicted ATPase/DNA-binding SARP family transcriptional activator